jgi:hypothetical protein
MDNGLFRLAYRALSFRTARAVLVGRRRCPQRIDQGRFTPRDVNRIMEQTWRNFDTLISDAPVQETPGGRRNVRMGVFTLANYQALRAAVDDKAYATELAADFCWRGYEQSISVSRWIARLVTRDPRKQMNLMMRMGIRYPFSRPDYDWKVHPDPDAFAVDFYRCPVFDYFKTQGEEAVEFFRNSWCTLDFPLAEFMVRGGRYERPHTLSAGDEVCDMRWIADKK